MSSDASSSNRLLAGLRALPSARFGLLAYLLVPLALAATYAGLAGCGGSQAPSVQDGESLASAEARQQLHAGVARLATRVDTLAAAVEALRTQPGAGGASTPAHAQRVDRAQAAFREARLAYKRVEPLVAYRYPQATDRLNGAALPEVEPGDSNRRVYPPEGFQVVEEGLFPAPPESGEALAQLAAQVDVLKANVERVNQYVGHDLVADRHVFEAAREHMVRLVSLGLSGFDSPVAFHALPEGGAGLRGLSETLAPFRDRLAEASPGLADSLFAALGAGADAMTAPDASFDAFDRLAFIRAHANPISTLLMRARDTLGISKPPVSRALQADAETPWVEGAFDPSYFAPAKAPSATPERVALGRLLFHDPALSGNGQQSCATCHAPQKAYTDGRVRALRPQGTAREAQATRNTPTLFNTALQASSSYDQKTTTVEGRIAAVLRSPNEMHTTPQAAAARLRESGEYATLFRQAFEGGEGPAIDADRVASALAAYVRSLTALNSPFDRYVRGETTRLDPAAKRGFNLFMGKALCGTCHFAPLFNGTVPPHFDETETEVLGVPTAPDTADATIDPDVGRFAMHEIEKDRFAFKTPTVRNAALTAPYMHNGAYATLDQVVDFYDRGGGAGIGIDLLHQTLPPEALDLTKREKRDLVAFMEALTDTSAVQPAPGRLPSLPGRSGPLRRP